MQRIILKIGVLIASIAIGISGCSHSGWERRINEPQILSEIWLPLPDNKAHQEYLGLSPNNEKFQLTRINAQVLIIEMFSMYCPHCQKEAPEINALYHQIEHQDNLRNRIKLIGIGVGNSLYEVNLFRKRYSIPFPLFPDKSFAITTKVNTPGTPYFVCIEIYPDAGYRTIYRHIGTIGRANQFLQTVLKQTSFVPDNK